MGEVMSEGDPTPTPPPLPPPSPGGLSETQWAVAIHLSPLLVFVAPGVMNIVGPLVIWLLKRPESATLDEVGKRVLNFQISYSIYFFALGLAAFLLSFILIGLLLVPLIPLLGIAWLVLVIVGAVKQGNGEKYRFPLVIDFFK